MTLKPGLVSITFRSLSPAEVIAVAADSGLAAVEWGGDVHVPHGDLSCAREVGRQTRDAGLAVSSYGSYYRFDDAELDFPTVLATAVALEAPIVRVWAGRLGSKDADEAEWRRIIEASRRVGAQAAEVGVVVCYEFHGGTLTDTNASAERLLREVDHPNVRTFWQPPNGRSVEYCREGLDAVLPWLEYLHCFYWRGEANERRPLAEGGDRWSIHFSQATSAAAGLEPRYVLLEFVPDNSLESLKRDAATLGRLLDEYR